MIATVLAFLDGVGFDPFFRGLLSFLTMFVVLCGATYLIIATNIGVRQGLLLSCAGLFGWMFIMGIVWVTYGAGWKGEEQSWTLLEVNTEGVLFSEFEDVQDLAGVNLESPLEDPDEAQAEVLKTFSASAVAQEKGWRYLITSDAARGDASSSAETFLLEENIFAAGEYVPLAYGAFNFGGKPKLVADPSAVDRMKQFFNETFLHPLHSQELMVIQFQAAKSQINETGAAPEVPVADPTQPVVSVVMERDRGGPIPSLISGVRFTPLMFTFFNGFVFLIFVLMLHNKDRREQHAIAAAS